MGQLDIANAKEGSLPQTFSTPSADTIGINESGKTEYLNDRFTEFYGYFTDHSELRAALLTKSTFIVGGGYECDPETEIILSYVNGAGKSSFRELLFNMDLGKRIARDSFAQIIRADNGKLLNIKVLNPGSIKIIFDKYGLIEEYQQIARIGDKNVAIKHFKPNEIFHLTNNQIFDSLCGFSDIEGLNKELLAELESFDDTKKTMRQVSRPFIIFKLKSDDPAKIAALDTKMKNVRDKGEGYMVIPDDENIITTEQVVLNVSQLIFQWREDLRKKFYRAIGLPELIVQSGDSTESGGKVGSLHFGNIIQRDQKYLEEQVWAQLGLKINLVPPETLASQLMTDTAKDGQNQQMDMQPSDMQAGVGR